MVILKEKAKRIRENGEANKAIPEGIIPIDKAAKNPAFKKWNINQYKKEGYSYFCTYDYSEEHDGKDLYVNGGDAYICKKSSDIKKLQNFDKDFNKLLNLVKTFDSEFNKKIGNPLEKLFGDNIPDSISAPLYKVWNDDLYELKNAMDAYEYEIPSTYPKVRIIYDDDLTGYNPD